MKNTQRRTAILQQVAAAGGPVSAEEIFEALRGQFPTLALSTVYRNLERFAQDGLLDKEVSPDGVFRYARREEHSHYLVCTQCHKPHPAPGVPPDGHGKGAGAGNRASPLTGTSSPCNGKCPRLPKAGKINRGFHGKTRGSLWLYI